MQKKNFFSDGTQYFGNKILTSNAFLNIVLTCTFYGSFGTILGLSPNVLFCKAADNLSDAPHVEEWNFNLYCTQCEQNRFLFFFSGCRLITTESLNNLGARLRVSSSTAPSMPASGGGDVEGGGGTMARRAVKALAAAALTDSKEAIDSKRVVKIRKKSTRCVQNFTANFQTFSAPQWYIITELPFTRILQVSVMRARVCVRATVMAIGKGSARMGGERLRRDAPVRHNARLLLSANDFAKPAPNNKARKCEATWRRRRQRQRHRRRRQRQRQWQC